MSDLPSGCLLNACYSIEKPIGRGGFGITYRAKDTKLKKPVAVKEYLPSPFAARSDYHNVEPFDSKKDEFEWGLSRFISEAQILAQFKHDNIVRVIAAFEQHGTAYMVMEYEDGVSLKEYFEKTNNDRSQSFFVNIMLSILGGLQGIHDKGFVHRDIKPANLMLRADSKNTPVLIDFGSARSTTSSETGILTAVVTPGYSPVEQYNSEFGEQGPWTDIYALAASIRAGITGEVPIASVEREVAVRAGDDPLAPLALTHGDQFSSDFLDAIDKGLSVLPEDRPQSLMQWQEMFDQTITDTDSATIIKSPSSPVQTRTTGSNSSTTLRSEPGESPGATRRDVDYDETIVSGNPESEISTAIDGTLMTRTERGPGRSLQVGHEKGEREIGFPGSANGKKSLAPAAAVASLIAIVGLTGFFFWSGDDTDTSTDIVVTDEPPKINTAAIEPEAVEIEPDSPEVKPGAEIKPEVETKPEAQVADTTPLPAPSAPIELISPENRVMGEVLALNSAADPLLEIIDNGEGVGDASDSIEKLLGKYRQLAESDVVRAFPSLKDEVSTGLVKLTNAAPEAVVVVEKLNRSAGSDVDTMLEDWKNLAGEERSELIFALASLSPDQRSSLSRQAELGELVDQIGSSVKAKIENRDFQQAARILEVALLVDSDNKALNDYKALLEGE